MAETTTGVDTPAPATLTDDEVNQAMATAFDNEGKEPAPAEETPAPEAKAPEPKPEEKNETEPEGKVSFEDLQKVRREQGNQKRRQDAIESKLDEALTLLKTLKPGTKQDEAKDEILELMKEVETGVQNGDLDQSAGKLFGKFGALLKEVKKSKQTDPESDADTKQAVGDLKAERAFDAANPALKGRWAELSERAWAIVEEEAGEHETPQEKQAAANFALRRIVKTLNEAAKKKATGASANTIDNTGRVKPTSSTKGAQTVQTSAAPDTTPDVKKLTDQELEDRIASAYEKVG